MLDRRRALQGGLAAIGSLSVVRAARRPRAAQAARQGPLQRGGALDPLHAGLCGDRQGLLRGGRHRADHVDRVRRRQVAGGATFQQRRHRADRAGDLDLRADQRLADQDPDLLRAHRHRRLHAGRPREGEQVRVEHAQGQGDPRLPARQHAAPVPRSGAAPERHRPAEGRQAHEQRRHSGARGLVAGRAEPIRHLHRAGRLAARARRQGALPGVDRRDRGPRRLHRLHGDRQIHPREPRGDPELDQRHRQGA